MTNIENAKAKLGKTIREIADGYGALKHDRTNSEDICVRDFEEAAGEWAYEFIKKIVLYGSGVRQDPQKIRISDYESVTCDPIPKYFVVDEEEQFASMIVNDEFE